MKTLITPELLINKGFKPYKSEKSFILNSMIFNFEFSNIAVLRKKIDEKKSEFIAGVEHWEDVNNFWDGEEINVITKRKKILIIETCKDCPHHNFDDGREEKKWGKSWCEKLDIEVAGLDIPENCPLPSA